MEKNITITYQGEARNYAAGTSVVEIAANLGLDTKTVMLAKVNGKLCEMFKNLYKDAEISFVTMKDSAGRKTYERGLSMVLLTAIRKVYGMEMSAKTCLEHTIGNGLYCEVKGGLPEGFCEKVKEAMGLLVKADKAIEKKNMNTSNAVSLFENQGMSDKVRLLTYRRSSKTNVYCLEDYTDYFYGYMPISTGCLDVFDVVPYKKGFLLMIPTSEEPDRIPSLPEREKLYQALDDAHRWGEIMDIITVGDLNYAIANGKTEELILMQEALTEKRLGDIAEKVRERGNVKFVMIAGPSSSGKTTFSHRLSIQLKTLGFKPHPIALDDFYIDREKTPKHPDGTYDFECLEALDIEMFNDKMQALLRGETVEMPTFNFKTGKSEFRGNTLTLGAEDILVIEGIHGLNDKLSYTLPKESKFKVYISALTELNVDLHNRIPTTDGRLLRRMVRDQRSRGTSARNTIAMWPSVRHGEENYIFPFQEEADYTFNSASIFELAVLKQYAEPLLFGITPDCPEYNEAVRLLKFLDYFLGIPTDAIPQNSIVREFIGGSCFNV